MPLGNKEDEDEEGGGGWTSEGGEHEDRRVIVFPLTQRSDTVLPPRVCSRRGDPNRDDSKNSFQSK